MPSLRRRKLPSGRTVWDVRYWQGRNQRVFTIGETDKRTAERIYRDFCVRLAEGKFDGIDVTIETSAELQDGPTLSELAIQARIYAEANKRSKTLEREQLSFNQFIKILGDIPVAELTPAKVEEYKAARLSEVKASTVNIEIRVLNTALSQAATLGWLKGIPQQHFKQIRQPEPEPPRWLNPDEIQQLLGVCDEEFRFFLQFLLNTGCRRNEALGVTWEDVDLKKRQIVIRGRIGKMGKRRTIPINDTLLKIFEEWPKHHEGRLFTDYTPNQVSMTFRRRITWTR